MEYVPTEWLTEITTGNVIPFLFVVETRTEILLITHTRAYHIQGHVSTIKYCLSDFYRIFYSGGEFGVVLPYINFFPLALRPNAGHGLLILEVSRSHTTTHHSR